MKASILVKNQVKKFRGEYTKDGESVLVVAEVRHDDRCGNGHNTFSVTGSVYNKYGSRRDGVDKLASGKTVYWQRGGCCHDDIAKAIPGLAKCIKWHLVDTEQPMHYVANVLYFAGDRDCRGMRKDEKKPNVKNDGTPRLEWVQVDTGEVVHSLRDADEYSEGDEISIKATQAYSIGKGTERELDSARNAAIWPDATDKELMQEPEVLRAALLARLPKLMEDFQRDVEDLGLVY